VSEAPDSSFLDRLLAALAGARDETRVHRVDLAKVVSTKHDHGGAPPRPTEVPHTAMVQWMHPKILFAAAKEVVVSALFARFADKREAEAALDAIWFDASGLDAPLWLDYASDTGDGFEPTYAIASLLGQDAIPVDGEMLPRGRILVLGGDQVYPAAEWDAYQERFVTPYTGALPYMHDGAERPLMFALPGNHDWYDGLTSFMRLFCAQRSIGAWQTVQSRSYFAIRLTEKRWLWAVDTQLDTYVDNPQLGYFWEMAGRLKDDHEVILVTAKPSWVGKSDDPGWNLSPEGTEADCVPQSWQTLAFLEGKLIASRGARVILTLTGDQHHYARYRRLGEGPAADKITSGGAGAYLSATHSLPPRIHLPDYEELRGRTASGDDRPAEGIDEWGREEIFPDEDESKRIAGIRSVFDPWLGRHTPEFALLTTAVYGLFGLFVWLAHSSAAVWSTLLVILTISLFLGLKALADVRARAGVRWSKLEYAFVHTALHLAPLAVLVVALLVGLGAPPWVAPLAAAALGFVWGPTAFSLYLLWAQGRGSYAHSNEIFAAQSQSVGTGYKHFLRLRIDSDGAVKVYPLGVRTVPGIDEWELASAGSDVSSEAELPTEPQWFKLRDGKKVVVKLIEEPIELSSGESD